MYDMAQVQELSKRFSKEVKPFDVIVRSHDGRKVGALGVYAWNYSHALEIARNALGIRGPMVAVKDYKAGTVHALAPGQVLSVEYIDDMLPQIG